MQDELARAWKRQHDAECRRIRKALIEDARNGDPDAINACVRQGIDFSHSQPNKQKKG